MATVVLLGTLDTKGEEYAYLARRVRAAGCEVILIDVGSLGPALATPEIGREEVALAAGADAAALAAGDRGAAIAALARGAAVVVGRLHAAGRLHGLLGLGGSGGTALVTEAMRALPIGVPKLMVSTVASGDTRPYVGATDIAMMFSVVDIAGINRFSARILSNAAAAIVGMARGYAADATAPGADAKPLIGATMFGVTTDCVTTARRLLEARGYEVLVFHAVGTGGLALEALVAGGFLVGVLDATTTELADELVGGVFSAGPTRLTAASAAGLPQVVSLGALDMVNFGPRETVPGRFHDRTLHVHNASVTLMRTTPEEAAELGRRVAQRLGGSGGPTAVFIPLRGVSAISTAGGVFHDPEADCALFDALRAGLGDEVEVHELDLAINDPRFATAMAERLLAMIAEQGER
ncbi:MAG: Transcriptional regulator [uncultured Thermomicrobiales bacterium]|uniref:Transcriptional regulator n=1 Tax=uncultured Thermomicrobiales bacterium TaxID=1645740 RepID=A0A6J4VX73_9BACT|nr:MAG: Transcriptional regulator [uncultured Thermomicrobiales bacterium]